MSPIMSTIGIDSANVIPTITGSCLLVFMLFNCAKFFKRRKTSCDEVAVIPEVKSEQVEDSREIAVADAWVTTIEVHPADESFSPSPPPPQLSPAKNLGRHLVDPDVDTNKHCFVVSSYGRSGHCKHAKIEHASSTQRDVLATSKIHSQKPSESCNCIRVHNCEANTSITREGIPFHARVEHSCCAAYDVQLKNHISHTHHACGLDNPTFYETPAVRVSSADSGFEIDDRCQDNQGPSDPPGDFQLLDPSALNLGKSGAIMSYSSSSLDDPIPKYNAYSPKQGVAWAPRAYSPTYQESQNELKFTSSLLSLFGSVRCLFTPGKKLRSNKIAMESNSSWHLEPSLSSSTACIQCYSCVACQRNQYYTYSCDTHPDQNKEHACNTSHTRADEQPMWDAKTLRTSKVYRKKSEPKLYVGSLDRCSKPINRHPPRSQIPREIYISPRIAPSDSRTSLNKAGRRRADASRKRTRSQTSVLTNSSNESLLVIDDPASVSEDTIDGSSVMPGCLGDTHKPTVSKGRLQTFLDTHDLSNIELNRTNLRTGRLLYKEKLLSVCCGSLRVARDSYPSSSCQVTLQIHRNLNNDEDRLQLLRDTLALRNLQRHENVLRLFGVIEEGAPSTPDGFEVILVTMRTHFHVTLHRLLTWTRENNQELMTPRCQATFALQICNGCRFLETQRLSPRLLRSSTLSLDPHCVIKIAAVDSPTSRVEQYRWEALECLIQVRGEDNFTPKSAVWSFGIVLWEMATFGLSPYHHLSSPNDVTLYLRNGKRLIKPDKCHREMFAIMCACWEERPRDRPTFMQLLRRITLYKQTTQPSKSPAELFPDKDDFWEDEYI